MFFFLVEFYNFGFSCFLFDKILNEFDRRKDEYLTFSIRWKRFCVIGRTPQKMKALLWLVEPENDESSLVIGRTQRNKSVSVIGGKWNNWRSIQTSLFLN